MNKAELIETLKVKARQLRVLRSMSASWEATGLEFAATLAESLPDPPAMAWQDEPPAVEEADAWVDGFDAPMCIIASHTGGHFLVTNGACYGKLDGRRWCPIPPPPPLPVRNGGEA